MTKSRDLGNLVKTGAVQFPDGLGTAGQALQVNSGATGLEFADAGGGGGAWNLISTTTISSAVVYVDYTSIGSYSRYVLLWQCTMSSANLPRLQIYDDGTIVDTSNYSFMRHDLGGNSSYDLTSVGVIGTTGVVSSFGRFEINTDAPRAVYNLTYGGFTGTDNTANHFITSGGMKSDYSITDIDGFRFRTTASSAVITGGKFSLYGISQ